MSALLTGLVLLLALWFLDRSIDRRAEIVGCTHDRGHVLEAVEDLRGNPTALVWACDKCPFQVALPLDRVSGGDWRVPHKKNPGHGKAG